jgi:group I intron endonuclease
MTTKTGIYLSISPSGNYYVGQSLDIDRRWRAYRGLNCKKQIMLYRSLVKHGAEEHDFRVLEECHKDEMNYLKRKWYDFFDRLGIELLNLNKPRGGGKYQEKSEVTKAKMSEARKGDKNPMFGRTGDMHPMFGRTGDMHYSRKNPKRPLGIYRESLGKFYGQLHVNGIHIPTKRFEHPSEAITALEKIYSDHGRIYPQPKPYNATTGILKSFKNSMKSRAKRAKVVGDGWLAGQVNR